MILKQSFFIFFQLLNLLTIAQNPPSIQWQKCYGGNGNDEVHSIQQTSDGGFIMAGFSSSSNGNVTANYGNTDFLVIKTDSTGTIQWSKSLGGSSYDQAYSIQQTKDEGYIVTGYSYSDDVDITNHHGFSGALPDLWVVKLNSSGDKVWQNSLGGSTGTDFANCVRQTLDGGYIIAGYTYSNNGDVTGYRGNGDWWVVKLSNLGIIEWQKALGSYSTDIAYSILQTDDGGYITAGFCGAKTADVIENHGAKDIWVVKLNGLGILEWQKSYGGSGQDEARSIQQTKDGGFVITGLSSSNDYDASGNHGAADFWILKINSIGDLQWQKSYGGGNFDQAHSVQQTSDGGYIVAGETSSNNLNVTGNHDFNTNYTDCWIIKLNNEGNLLWQKAMGGTYIDKFYSIIQTKEGTYLAAGFTTSNDGDVINSHINSEDFWLVKLASETATFSITYTFIGNGNWDNPNNWKDKIIPINPVPAGTQIIISTSSNNECVLNVPVTISHEAAIVVEKNAHFIIMGNLTITK